MTKGTLRIATTLALPALMKEHGLDPVTLLAEFGLGRADFDDPENTIAFTQLDSLLGRCAEAARCAHFGLLVGQRAGISSLGTVGFLMQSAPDVRTALEIAVRHMWVHSRNSTVDLVVDGAFASLRYVSLSPHLEHRDQLLDMALAIEVNVLRSLCGQQWRPSAVRFAHVRPKSLVPFRRFFQAPLEFDAGETAVVFPSEWLQAPLPGADPLLHLMMQHRVDELAQHLGDDLVHQLRRMLPALVAARSASIAVAAMRVGLSVRTLNRRLRDDGTSFRQLRDEVRYATARQLLQGTSMPASQIADRLGYANPSAFTRAFGQWAGTTPAEWRATKRRRTLKRPMPPAGLR